MFEIVRAIREALGVESTLGFVAIMALAFAFLGAGAGWIVDRAYKNTSARQQVQRGTSAGPPQNPAEVPTAIFMETRMMGLPINIPPKSVIHVVSPSVDI